MNASYKLSRRLPFIALGFTAWAVAFIAIYGMQAVGCRLAWHEVEVLGWISLQRLQQIVLYAIGLGASVVLYRALRTESRRVPRDATAGFLANVSAYGALAAIGAVAVSFVGVLWLSAC